MDELMDGSVDQHKEQNNSRQKETRYPQQLRFMQETIVLVLTFFNHGHFPRDDQ
jgi:hypothetical protein